MGDFFDAVAILLRALPHLSEVWMVMGWISAFLAGVATGRILRHMRRRPARLRLSFSWGPILRL